MMGAAPLAAGGVRFRVWAPRCERVELCLVSPDKRTVAMERGDDGVWEATVADCEKGWRYAYRVDGAGPFPDPASRRQPLGVHGPSEVVDVGQFTWTDAGWTGLEPHGQVIYECHVGTATPDGTFDSLIDELPRLVELGTTAIELLPVAAFPGTRNWGYDG
ncbi:MAG: malto-oligosyltrehalose trehalohydrolase, partial [Pseudomonadota bacterium]